MSKKSTLLFSPFLLLVLSLPAFSQSGPLPPVTGVQFDGTQISWDPLPGAAGYNVHLNFDYLDTVRSGTSHVPTRSGRYSIAAFDELGNFSPLQIIDNDVVATSNSVDVELGATGEIDPPANLTGTVYSRTAGELFWDRVHFQAIEYDVSLNGVFLGATNGTSYFVGNLTPFSANILLVVARNESGQGSQAVSLVFDTARSEFPHTVTGDDSGGPDPGGLSAPQNPRLTVYSLTAAELLWARPPASENVVSTEISRDGVIIGAAEGNSFYDGNRESGQAYFYELVAINSNGDRSLASLVHPNPFDGDTATVVNRMLVGISEVTARNPHQRLFPLLRDFTRGRELHSELVLQDTTIVTDDELGTYTRSDYDCATGSLVIESVESRFGIFRLFFDGCSSGDRTYDGNLSIANSDIGGFSANYDQLTIHSEDENVLLNGEVVKTVGRAANFTSESYQPLVYELIDNEQPNTLLQTTQVVLRQEIVDNLNTTPRSTFTTDFTVTAGWTYGQNITVTTTQEFQDADLGLGNYLSGELVATGADGQHLHWDVRFPDASGWYATVRKSDSTFGITGNWSDEIALPCLSITAGDDAIPGCAGF